MMTKEELCKALDHVNHSREKRKEMATLVLNNQDLVKPLLEIAFEQNNHISSKSCWVLEFTAKEKLAFIFPHLSVFAAGLNTLHLHPSVRPMAKICEYLILGYFKKKDSSVQKALNNNHLERITAACFDWILGDHKVAAQAYSMTCLLLLGQKFDWVHPELKMILEQNYARGSAAYKARARLTLAKLK